MSTPTPPRPLTGIPMASGHDVGAVRGDTVLPPEADEVTAALSHAQGIETAGRGAALAAICTEQPASLQAWAALGEHLQAGGDTVPAYACARVAYHRGLDGLRRNGWGGTGRVRWAEPTNRGFLRGLRLLLVCAAALGERDESARCREFLLELDPDDGLGAAVIPERPGPEWTPPPPPAH